MKIFQRKETDKILRGQKSFKSKEENKGKNVVCYQCKKPKHIKPDRPLLKKRKGKYEKKKQALKAEMWSDTKCESSDDDEANLCLMADFENDEENEVNIYELYYEEMQDFLEEIFEEHKKASKRIEMGSFKNQEPKSFSKRGT